MFLFAVPEMCFSDLKGFYVDLSHRMGHVLLRLGCLFSPRKSTRSTLTHTVLMMQHRNTKMCCVCEREACLKVQNGKHLE